MIHQQLSGLVISDKTHAPTVEYIDTFTSTTDEIHLLINVNTLCHSPVMHFLHFSLFSLKLIVSEFHFPWEALVLALPKYCAAVFLSGYEKRPRAEKNILSRQRLLLLS